MLKYYPAPRLFALIMLALSIGPCGAAAEERPQRIVSINLCADQYLLALAAPDQILALSPFATDPRLSFYADRAQGFARVADDAESVLILKPGLVFASAFNQPSTLAFLRRQGVKVMALPQPAGLSAIRAQIREVASLLGRKSEGEALLARFDKTIAATAGGASGRGLSALYYERGGYVTGTMGLVHDLITHLGLRNAAEKLGIRGMAPVAIEAVLAGRPDVLIVPDYGAAADQGAALLSHPALQRLYPPKRRLVLPVRETVCPGPSIEAALLTLARGLSRFKKEPATE